MGFAAIPENFDASFGEKYAICIGKRRKPAHEPELFPPISAQGSRSPRWEREDDEEGDEREKHEALQRVVGELRDVVRNEADEEEHEHRHELSVGEWKRDIRIIIRAVVRLHT